MMLMRQITSNVRMAAVAALFVMFQIVGPALSLQHASEAGGIRCATPVDASAFSNSSSQNHQQRHSTADSHAECCFACGGALHLLENVVSSSFVLPYVALNRPEPARAGPIFAQQFQDTIVGPRGPPAR